MAPVAIILLSAGVMFKMLHWPAGAHLLLVGSLLGIIAIILGTVYSVKQHSGCVCTKVFVGVSLAVAIIAGLFKVCHFPGAGILCLIALVLISVSAILLAICFAHKKD